MNLKLKNKFRNIKLLVMDFDGVMTDGFVYVDQNGRETVRASRKDGLGIELLKKHGFLVGVLSKEKNPVVSARCRKLRIPYWQGLESSSSKLGILKQLLREKQLARETVAYIGDDLNDIKVLNYVGLAIAVGDAHPAVKQVADYTTRSLGGNHAVREVAELLLKAHGLEIDDLI